MTYIQLQESMQIAISNADSLLDLDDETSQDQSGIRNALDPLLERLSREYVDEQDLSERLEKLFTASTFIDAKW